MYIYTLSIIIIMVTHESIPLKERALYSIHLHGDFINLNSKLVLIIAGIVVMIVIKIGIILIDVTK